jgi:two-component system chemotaxis response regulator CheB
MGSDGRDGAAAVKRAGGYIVAQSPATCVVDGMPRSVIEAGLADAVASPVHLIEMLLQLATDAGAAKGAA